MKDRVKISLKFIEVTAGGQSVNFDKLNGERVNLPMWVIRYDPDTRRNQRCVVTMPTWLADDRGLTWGESE